ncbi:Stp1/IreP family PP2C-type Ser/Thr phosphatase [Aneurinibacillus uraniidurans]|uniref:Stp1/IreP family PP2C-type Ser/Thr phosphatase n=1 Tax=Aneurinibacillus uraniidurans TaxID=2966586 RepID=UPI00234B97DC|nr:Stp1/IreP family PP2C-type Ser/Thr phosphatase [Aneurinibacillus sp. B1]WCN39037.1 Stp1/IreP family PP2C-type Ser/Thr phosphatase [Aneurinibacillus sp. B1]
MQSAIQTHIGCVRQTNEDSGRIQNYDDGWTLAIVADGMGGHQAGDVASQMAVESICEHMQFMHSEMTPDERQRTLNEAIQAANQKILAYAAEHPECRGMGTTIVAALMNSQLGVLAHIGDSRIYRYSGGVLQQITSDHTLVNELLRNHQITQAEAANHPRRNILTRALGTDQTVKADFSILHWDEEDMLLLCSDGLSGKVSGEIIADILEGGSLKQMAETLIAHALEAGGEDNITVILLRNQTEGVE